MRALSQRILLSAGLLAAGLQTASADIFEPLFTVTRVVGAAQVVRPGRTAEPLRADHSYPYGSRIVVPDEPMTTNGVPAAPSEVMLELARDFRFRLGQGTDVVVADLSVGEGEDRSEIKEFDMSRGSLATFITANVQKTGGGLGDAQAEKNLAAIVVKTPVGECTRLSQRNEVTVTPVLGGTEAVFRTQSGTMEVSGQQFTVKNMKKNAAISVSGDDSHTLLSTVNGECVVAFEKGADGEERAQFKSRCVGRIWRQHAEVGGRMAVAVMIYYPKGNTYEMKSYNYLEGQTNVGMWTSVAAAVSGEHSALAVSEDLAAGGVSGADDWSSGSSGGDYESEDDGGWNPDEAGDEGGDDGFDDFGDDDFNFGF